ncbi:50S ribosomal protein L22 [Candidatus Uhrbacteria bacterium]|nr:50S ribosomal protein L22 [Candidatus Uhrbacteria bacterium]MBD3284405.1 50S ribosomal protein L22 [Candidatus Uhrbacteria bacterium]
MQVNARLRYLRMSPRKVRLVIDVVRGLPVQEAVHQLTFSPKEAAGPILKLLKSAMANAENNYQADLATLRVAKITADGGPTLNRWRARAFGRAAPIRKRTSHVEIVLSDEAPVDVHASQVRGKRTSTKPSAINAKKTDKTSKENNDAVKKEKAASGDTQNAKKETQKKPADKKSDKPATN